MYDNLTLIEPTESMREEFLAFRREFPDGMEIPGTSSMSSSTDFATAVRNCLNYAKGLHLPEGWVAVSTFWLVRNNRTIIGVTELRHALTPFLEREGGHIGYSVRPSEQGMGYATSMLGMTLEKVRQIGLHRVLITCDKRNIASARVIQKNKGILENEVPSRLHGREFTQRYWIEL